MSESQAFKSTPEYGQEALRDHIVDKASAARRKYGGATDYPTMLRILDDTDVVRYPTGIRFDAGPLERGEFALLQPLGDEPASGFCLFVHPAFQERPDALPLLIAHHIVRINYGEIATHVEDY